MIGYFISACDGRRRGRKGGEERGEGEETMETGSETPRSVWGSERGGGRR